jgi:hypothetical protein
MFKIATLVFCLIFSVSLGAQDFEYADTTSTKKSTIYTVDGGQFVGKVIKNNDKEVVIETLNIGKVTIPKYQISEIIEGSAITSAQFVISSFNGGVFVGTIIKNDDKEVTIETRDLGKITIPKFQIKEIKQLDGSNFTASGDYQPNQVFATRYFGTTNALSIKKGESYVKYTLIGPDIQFGVADNVTVGIITSWIAVPLIVTIKSVHELTEESSFGYGVLIGNMGWPSLINDLGFNLGVLPFATYTKGNRRRNINFALGYGQVWAVNNSGGAVIGSIGGIVQIGKKASFVFDSIVFGSTLADFGFLLTPGLRFQKKDDAAFQFGFSFVASRTGINPLQIIPVPIPRFAWFRKF